MRKETLWILIGLLVMGLCWACSDDSDEADDSDAGDTSTTDTSDTSGAAEVEVFSWWTAPGEADALAAAFNLYRLQYPSVTINNVATDSWEDNVALLADRMAGANPPDAFQSNGADEVNSYLDKLLVLNQAFAERGWNTVIQEYTLADVTQNDNIYAVPTNVHRENGVFYNMAIFTELGINPDSITTFDQLIAACDTIKAAGYDPIALSYQGWILRLLFNSVWLTTDKTSFLNYYNGVSFDAAMFATVTQNFITILDNYTNADAVTNIEWDACAGRLTNTPPDGGKRAAMYFHGDWVKGYLQTIGQTPGVDFGIFAAPGAADVFMFGADTFGIPAQADRQTEALDFLDVLVSQEGQAAFNKLKGSCPVRADVDLTTMDPVAQKVCAELNNPATTRIHIPGAWDGGFDANFGAEAVTLCGANACVTEFTAFYQANLPTAK